MSLGGWSVDQDLVDYIHTILAHGKTVLELGSGEGTDVLAKWYTMYSVEHDEKFLNLHSTNYIFAPLKTHKAYGCKHLNKRKEGEDIDHEPAKEWYDPNVLREKLPKEYDLLLIDGPSGHTRCGMIRYWDLFKQDVPIVIDDLHRHRDYSIAISISNRVKRPLTIYNAWAGTGKMFGVIL